MRRAWLGVQPPNLCIPIMSPSCAQRQREHTGGLWSCHKLTSVTPSPPSCQLHHCSQCCDTKRPDTKGHLQDLVSLHQMPSLCPPVSTACSLHLQECISSLSPLTALILHHPLCLHSLLHPTFMVTPQSGKRHNPDKAERTLQKGSRG